MAKSIAVVVTGNGAPLRKALGDVSENLANFGNSVKKFALPAAAALGAVAFAGFDAAKAAMEDQAAAKELARQLKATTKATEAQVKQTERFVEKVSLATGASDDDLRPALAALTRGTRDLGKAQKALGLAQDIATSTGKPLQTVSEALAKAYAGNMTALSRLSPEVRQMVKDHESLESIVARLGETYGGSTAANAETLAGRFRILNTTVKEIKEQIGYALLPIFETIAKFIQTTLIPRMKDLADTFSEKGLSGVIKEAWSNFSTFIEDATGWKAVIIDLTGTVGALVLAFKGFTIISSITASISGLATTLSGLGAFIPGALGASFGAIATTAGLAFVAVYTLIDALRDSVFRSDAGRTVSNALRGIATAAIFVFNVIASGINFLMTQVANLINLAIDGVNKINPFKDIPHVPQPALIPTFNYIPQLAEPHPRNPTGVRKMAAGGLVTSPTMALVGEAGPEAVIPLDRLGRMGGNSYQITVNAGVGDPREIGRQIVDAIRQYERTAGPVFSAA